MKIKCRLDTGKFFIVKENGDLVRNAKGIIYFDDIVDAEKFIIHYKRHNTAFEKEEPYYHCTCPDVSI